jgi:hypothetical protein
MCEVKVWYVIDAPTHHLAIETVANNPSPTTVSGSDYEIVSDKAITFTMVEAI